MRKIGIITIPDYNNYGNRLQNYAVKNFFEKKGYYVETLEMNDPDFQKYKARKQKLQLKKRKNLLYIIRRYHSDNCSNIKLCSGFAVSGR